MEQEHSERSGFSGGVAKVLNAGGSAVVFLYDVSAGALGGLFSFVKKAPDLPRKAAGMFTGGLGTIWPSATKDIEAKIKDYEAKIQALYYEIGKQGVKCTDVENQLEVESLKKLIADVREYEKEIQRLKDRIVELEAQSREETRQKRQHAKEAGKADSKEEVSYDQTNKAIEAAIKKSLKHGVFETGSERAIFDKVAHDLLDSEMEIKILAAAELGKMGNDAAVPVLCEAAGFADPSLTSEIINSLINIGDPRAIALFKAKVKDSSKYRVRIGCLRGLYKLAGDQELLPILAEALRDEHPEVRRTAATFIGWKDYAEAVPALVQSIRDEDARVRKAAASSLANIKDESAVLPLIKLLGDSDPEVREKALDAIKMITREDLSFDIHASGSTLAEAIETVREWWQEERLSKEDLRAAEEAVAAYPAFEAAEAAKAEADLEAEETAAADLDEEAASFATAAGLEEDIQETEDEAAAESDIYQIAASVEAEEMEEVEEPAIAELTSTELTLKAEEDEGEEDEGEEEEEEEEEEESAAKSEELVTAAIEPVEPTKTE